MVLRSAPGEQQCRVLAEDRGLEVLELRSGFDPELFDEGRPGGPIRLQGVRLPFGAVERQHQLAARPLAERLLCNEGLELGHELVVAAEREIDVDALLEGALPKLLETQDLGLRERLVREVGERRAAPQLEGLPEDGRRRLLVLHRPSGARLGEKALEASDVHGDALHVERIAGLAGDERRGAEKLTELRHRVLERRHRGLRHVGTPELLDEPIDPDGLAGAQGEEREQRALPALGDLQQAVVVDDRDGTEEPHLHRRLVTPATKKEKPQTRESPERGSTPARCPSGRCRPTVDGMTNAQASTPTRLDVEALLREIRRYLAAVDEFRRLGHEPRWQPEEARS